MSFVIPSFAPPLASLALLGREESLKSFVLLRMTLDKIASPLARNDGKNMIFE